MGFRRLRERRCWSDDGPELDSRVRSFFSARDGSRRTDIADELAARLVAGADARIPNVFGSVKVRVAWHLVELATEVNGRHIAKVTRQELADPSDPAREVFARVLLAMSQEGLIAREGPVVLIQGRQRSLHLARPLDD